MAREFLSQRKFAYTEKDVTEDPEAFQELVEMGILTTPVLVIGEETVIGFDRGKIEALMAA